MFPDPPNVHAVLTLLLTGAAICLFAWSRLALATSALAVLTVLLVGFELFPFEETSSNIRPESFFLGFGHEALVSICALMILGNALEKTGALQPVALTMARYWPKFPMTTLLVTLVAAAILSAFVNNTPIVVLLLPMLVSVSIRARTSAADVLLPMGLSTIIGGMATTIGTSTNLLVVAIAADMGIREFQMFDFAVPALIVGTIGILFLWIVSPRLIPRREPPLPDLTPRIFSTVFEVTPESHICGKTLADARMMADNRLKIRELWRGRTRLTRLPTVVLQSGDRFLVNDSPDVLSEIQDQLALARPDDGQVDREFTDEPQKLAQVVVSSGSLLDGRSLAEIRFDERYDLLPVAISAKTGPDPLPLDLSSTLLSVGDVVLVQGTQTGIDALKRSEKFLVLDGVLELPKKTKAKLTLTVMILVVGLAAFNVLSIAIAATCGVLALLLGRCIDWQDTISALSAPVVLIVVTSLALGNALIETGGAQWLADLFVYVVMDTPIPMTLSGLMLLMAILTNIVSNNAAAIIGTPISIDIATSLSAPIEPFLLAVIFGANMSFASPIGYKTNLLVMSAGGYRFGDFVRVGVPLTLLMWIGFTLLLPLLYDLSWD